MKEQSWWIHQDSNTEPWSIHLTAQKEHRKIRATTEIYADWINTPNKRFLLGEMSIVQPDKLIQTIGKVLSIYDHPLTKEDREHIEQSLIELKYSFID